MTSACYEDRDLVNEGCLTKCWDLNILNNVEFSTSLPGSTNRLLRHLATQQLRLYIYIAI